MACDGVPTPQQNYPHPKLVNPPSSKFFNLPQASNFLLPTPTGNKKHEDVK